MPTQHSSQEGGGVPVWLPLAGAVIALLVFGLVIIKNNNTRGTVGITAPAGATPNRMPDEGDVLRAQQAKQGRK